MLQSVQRESSYLIWGGALISIALLVSLVLGHGFELQGMSRGSFVYFLAGILALFAVFKADTFPRRAALYLGIATTVYFALRACFSEVWDLGRADLNLISCSWISISLVALLDPKRSGLQILVGGIALSVLLNAGYAIGQIFLDQELRLFNSIEVEDRAVGVMGHPNSLGGYLAIATPFLLGALFFFRARTARVLLLLVLIVGIVAAFLSQSRGGMIALVAGFITTAFLCAISHFKDNARKLVLCWVTFGVLAMSLIPVGAVLLNHISESRGHGSGVERVLSKNGRLDFMGLAIEQWIERPFLGWGSRSYSYESNRRWEAGEIPSWVGSAEMVHSEYLQVLADYGLLGVFFLLSFVLVVVFTFFWSGQHTALDFGALGGLVAVMTHSFIDFTPHILPVAGLTAICLGVLSRERSKRAATTGDRCLISVGLLMTIFLAGIISFQNWKIVPQYFKLERLMLQKGPDAQVMSLMKKVLERSPDYDLARLYGRLNLEQYEQKFSEELLQSALWGLEMAVTRHPYDAESAGNFALALSRAGEPDRASKYYQRAISAAWRRERDFGLMGAYSEFLMQQGNVEWHRRKPELALEYFYAASSYLEASVKMRSRYRAKAELKSRKDWLTERIEFLEKAGITKSEQLGIPAPPVEVQGYHATGS